MLSKELLTQLHSLSRVDKLRVVQMLANELAVEEGILDPTVEYEIWSPYDSAGAAEQLSRMLEEDQKTHNG
jgi:hypothetical protein